MFDGSTREKRAVRLGGRSTVESNEAMLRRVRAERLQRSEERAKVVAGKRLQAWWRGRAAARAWRRAARATWQGQTRDLAAVRGLFAAQGAAFLPPPQAVATLARAFTTFFDVRTDCSRLEHMCELVVEAGLDDVAGLAECCVDGLLASSDDARRLAPAALGPAAPATRRLLLECCQRLAAEAAAPPQPLRPWRRVVDLGARACRLVRRSPGDATAAAVVKLAAACAAGRRDAAATRLRLALAVDVVSREASRGLARAVVADVAALAAVCDAVESAVDGLGALRCGALLAAISGLHADLAAAARQAGAPPGADDDRVADVARRLIEAVPNPMLLEEALFDAVDDMEGVTSARADDESDSDSDGAGQSSSSARRSSPTNAVILLDAAATAFVAARDRREQARLRRPATPPPAGRRAAEPDDDDDDAPDGREATRLLLLRRVPAFLRGLLARPGGAAPAAVRLCAAVVRRCARAPVARLAGMGPQPAVVAAVLDCVAFTDRGALVASLWRAASIGDAAGRGDALVVFAAAYSQLLLALDDESVYAQKQPFDLGEIVDVAKLVGKALYRALWTEAAVSAAADVLEVAVLAQFFNQLHDRIERLRSRLAQAGDAAGLARLPPAPDLWCWPLQLAEARANGSAMDVDAGSRGDDAAALSREPRVAQILAAVPFVVPFFQRLALFQALIAQDRGDDGGLRPIELRATIRRDRLFEDAYAELSVLDPSKLKGRIQVIFVNEAGHEEAGIDGGGVFKEFLDELTKVAFGDSTCLFSQAEGGTDLVATASAPADLRRLEFCGRVIGKALYERVLVEPRFARFFLNKVLGKYNYFDDLSSLDADLYTHLVRLKRAGADDVAALDLTFELHSNGRDVELCSGGRSTKVDAANRGRYVQLVAHHRLNVECAAPSAAFLRGVRAVVPTRWLRMFDPEELQTLISGDEAPIDVEDWRGHVHYGGGYHASQPIIQWFWDVVTDFDAKERAQLLRFVTSCSRPPLLGFSQLHPLLSIHRVPIQSDDERLPTSGTCMNLLKLPHYSSREALREKLLYAVQNAHGFELS